MSKNIFDFISSFGIMLIGVCLLFFGSLSYPHVSQKVSFLPKSKPRIMIVGGDEQLAVLPISHPNVPLKKDQAVVDFPLSSTAVILMDDKTDTILFEKNADVVRPLASITKLMSVLVLLDLNPDWSKVVEITPEVYDNYSHFVNIGEKFTMGDLWNVALIGSSNTAINALVSGSGIKREHFITKMNEKAQDLRLRSLRFVEPTGIDERDVGTARDVARLLKYALASDKIFNTLQISEYYAQPFGQKPRRIWTTDWLLTKWVPNKFGDLTVAGKTGFIENSKYNFAVRIQNSDKRAIRTVVLGADTMEARFSEARDLATWAFDHYAWPGDSGYDKLAQ
ncbi:MAG: D-alanyl-D-alanine carboxypeptidase family protein [uncultured bacterium]|nr:MAG: D-alanyl-D-alanine carboxypeptidase family protein [uncultured bacterium]